MTSSTSGRRKNSLVAMGTRFQANTKSRESPTCLDIHDALERQNHVMNNSIHFILLSLAAKCLLSWTLVFLQRSHICKSFAGVFSVSLTAVDTTLTFIFITIRLHGDGQLFLLGLQLTKYHVCLLVQIAGEVYSGLQYPVVVVAALDHWCSTSPRLQAATCRSKTVVHSLVTVCLWCFALLCIFLLWDFHPVLEDVSHYHIHQCWTFHVFQIPQLSLLIFITLGSATFYTRCSSRLFTNPPKENPLTDRGGMDLRTTVVSQALSIFLNTWGIFLFFLAALLLLPVEIPSYLGLNVAWLCFLNSFLIGVVLCVVCPAAGLERRWATVPPDSFCEWKFKCSLSNQESPTAETFPPQLRTNAMQRT